MCDEKQLKSWASNLNRRQFGVVAGAGAIAACAPKGTSTADGQFADNGLTETEVSFQSEDGTMDGLFIYSPGVKRPGVIHWPDIAGVRESHRNMARRVAAEGYSVLLINPYYRDVAGEQFADFASFIEAGGFSKVRPWRNNLSSFAIKRDAKAIVSWLDQRPEVDNQRGIGTQGFCMGGPFTVYSAHAVPARINAAASFHGGGLVREDEESPHRLLAQTEAAFLFAVARDDDAKAPNDKIALAEAAEDAGRPAKIDVYDGNHGWTVPDSPAYNREAADLAFADLIKLYRSAL